MTQNADRGTVLLDVEILQMWADIAELCLSDVGWNPEDGYGHSLAWLVQDIREASQNGSSGAQ